MSAVACSWSQLLLYDRGLLTDRRTETDDLPVSTEPSNRKMPRKRFPMSVPHLSIIFPWQMVKMIPNICNDKTYALHFLSCGLLTSRGRTRMFADLSRTVEQAGRRSLWFWVGELDRILKAQRQISSHKEPADKYWGSHCKYLLCSVEITMETRNGIRSLCRGAWIWEAAENLLLFE